MDEYHKIQTLFRRDMERNGKTLLEGQWTLPEFEYLAANAWVFTEQVQLICYHSAPAQWKCRHCKVRFTYEPQAS